MSRHLNIDRLPRRRVVIGFTRQGLRPGRFWIVLEPEEPSPCLRHPGFNEDLEVTVKGLLRWEGLPRDIKAFPTWFGPSGFAPFIQTRPGMTTNRTFAAKRGGITE